MHQLIEPTKIGLKKGLDLLWLFLKIIVPVTLVVVFLDQLGVIDKLGFYFAPLMRAVGLPGEAAIPLFLGFFVNIYASVGAILALELGSREITVLATMILISHSLLIECAICKQVGLGWLVSLTLRIGTALIVGIILNLLFLLLGGVV